MTLSGIRNWLNNFYTTEIVLARETRSNYWANRSLSIVQQCTGATRIVQQGDKFCATTIPTTISWTVVLAPFALIVGTIARYLSLDPHVRAALDLKNRVSRSVSPPKRMPSPTPSETDSSPASPIQRAPPNSPAHSRHSSPLKVPPPPPILDPPPSYDDVYNQALEEANRFFTDLLCLSDEEAVMVTKEDDLPFFMSFHVAYMLEHPPQNAPQYDPQLLASWKENYHSCKDRFPGLVTVTVKTTIDELQKLVGPAPLTDAAVQKHCKNLLKKVKIVLEGYPEIGCPPGQFYADPNQMRLLRLFSQKLKEKLSGGKSAPIAAPPATPWVEKKFDDEENRLFQKMNLFFIALLQTPQDQLQQWFSDQKAKKDYFFPFFKSRNMAYVFEHSPKKEAIIRTFDSSLLASWKANYQACVQWLEQFKTPCPYCKDCGASTRYGKFLVELPEEQHELAAHILTFALEGYENLLQEIDSRTTDQGRKKYLKSKEARDLCRIALNSSRGILEGMPEMGTPPTAIYFPAADMTRLKESETKLLAHLKKYEIEIKAVITEEEKRGLAALQKVKQIGL